MGNKTITMPLSEYEGMLLDNKIFKQQYDELKQKNKVYVCMNRIGYLYEMSGQIVEKDALFKKLQGNLELLKEQAKEREDKYQKRIYELEQELYQKSTAKINWWKKLLNNGK